MCELNSGYGYYTIISEPYKIEYCRNGARRFRLYVTAKCVCGKIKEVRLDGLKSGHVVSCGCYNRKLSSELKSATKHGLRYHPLNGVWKSMKYRCFNKNSRQYGNYGGRGITVCDEWKDNFKVFYDWAMVNGYREGLEIDRENNNGNYDPKNCRFVTSVINANNKRNNIRYDYNGEKLTLPQIAKITGLGFPTLYRRINENNLSVSEALSIPLNGKCKKEPYESRILSFGSVIEIFASTEKTKVLCKRYNVHRSTIQGIRAGTRYSDYTQKEAQKKP